MKRILWLALLLTLAASAPAIQAADTTPPQITINEPSYPIYATSAVNAEISLDEDASWCSYSLDSTPNISMEGGPRDWNIAFDAVDGFHNITFYCSDTSGNVNQSGYRYIMTDTTAPVIEIENYPDPAESYSNIRFRINCTDAVSGCRGIDIKLPFAECNVWANEGTLYEITAPYCASGTYTYTANATDNVGNSNTGFSGTLSIKKSKGCECSSTAECYDSACILSTCTQAGNPSLSFYFESGTLIPSGTEWTIPVLIKNNLAIEDRISLELTGLPQKIEYWSVFDNNENNIVLRLGPGEETFTTIKLFGGKVGTYTMRIKARSLSAPAYSGEASLSINIIEKEETELLSRSPGISASAYIAVMLAGILLMRRKNLL